MDSEPTDEKAKCIWHVCKIWGHYEGCLHNDISQVAYLCAVHLKICEDSSNPDNCDPEAWEDVEQI